MPDTRLIERWLPIAELGEESTRERRSMTALPPTYYLHVWWARRPLVASRAAVLASLLPADADREKFLRVLGIHGDPVTARSAIDKARRTGIRVKDPYGYARAFGYSLDQTDTAWLKSTLGNGTGNYTVLDPTAGGGSIPFENDPHGSYVTCQRSESCGRPNYARHCRMAIGLFSRLEEPLHSLGCRVAQAGGRSPQTTLSQRHLPERVDATYLWARTIKLVHIAMAVVPLSPNWRLAPDGTGGQAEAKPCYRQWHSGPRLHVRDRPISQGTVVRNGRARRWHLPIYPIAVALLTVMKSKHKLKQATWASSYTLSFTKNGSSSRLRAARPVRNGSGNIGRRTLRTKTPPRFRQCLPKSCRSGRRWTSYRRESNPRR